MILEEDQVLETEDEVVTEDEASDEVQSDDPEIEEDQDDEEDRVVTIGDEPADEEDDASEEAPGWVKKVRKVNRKLESEVKRLKRELQERSTATTAPAPPVTVPEKPTLKQFNYDAAKFEVALTEYHEKKKEYEAQVAAQEKAQEELKQKWQQKHEVYATKKQEHKFRDFDDAEEVVSNSLSVTQQEIIVQGADDSALVVYALGKNPKKLEELGKITDPVEFAFKVAKLEAQLKVTSRKPPAPERRVSTGNAGGLSGTADKTLERLRAEAEKTGDVTKVVAYKRQKGMNNG